MFFYFFKNTPLLLSINSNIILWRAVAAAVVSCFDITLQDLFCPPALSILYAVHLGIVFCFFLTLRAFHRICIKDMPVLYGITYKK